MNHYINNWQKSLSPEFPSATTELSTNPIGLGKLKCRSDVYGFMGYRVGCCSRTVLSKTVLHWVCVDKRWWLVIIGEPCVTQSVVEAWWHRTVRIGLGYRIPTARIVRTDTPSVIRSLWLICVRCRTSDLSVLQYIVLPLRKRCSGQTSIYLF